jgi:hypothetical protein
MRRPSNEQSPHEVGAPSAGLDQSLNLEGEDNRQVESLVALWADRIRPHLAQAVEGIVAAGRELTEAKAALPHGQFGPLLRALGLSRHMANPFMRVAANRVLANGAPVHALPAAVSVLDTLTQLPDDELEAAIEAGEITPSTTRQQAANLVGRKAMRPRSLPAPNSRSFITIWRGPAVAAAAQPAPNTTPPSHSA